MIPGSEIDPYHLIQHTSLKDLLGLIQARDEVRAMVADEPPPCSYYDTEPVPTATTRAPRAA